MSPESLGRLEAHQSMVHFEVIKPKLIFSVWEPVVKNVPKHGKSRERIRVMGPNRKIDLRRYWTDFKNVGSFETAKFSLIRI